MRPVIAEFLGTAFLLCAVVGSGIMGARLSAGNDALALLANSVATGGALVALIAVFGPISGAHFNPAVTIFEFIGGRTSWPVALSYVPAQVAGSVCGVIVPHAMFGLPLIQDSHHVRASTGELICEVVATLGLLLTIWGVARSRPDAVPIAVASYIVGAYWFTSSTSFANPAATVTRSLTDKFAGIASGSVIGFLVAQVIAVLLATVTAWTLSREITRGGN